MLVCFSLTDCKSTNDVHQRMEEEKKNGRLLAVLETLIVN